MAWVTQWVGYLWVAGGNAMCLNRTSGSRQPTCEETWVDTVQGDGCWPLLGSMSALDKLADSGRSPSLQTQQGQVARQGLTVWAPGCWAEPMLSGQAGSQGASSPCRGWGQLCIQQASDRLGCSAAPQVEVRPCTAAWLEARGSELSCWGLRRMKGGGVG